MKKIKLSLNETNIEPLSQEEMISAEESRFWPFDNYCGVSGTCPDGHKVSCTAVREDSGTCKHLYSSVSSGTQTLIGVKCGDVVVNCNNSTSGSGTMPIKVKACLDLREGARCSYFNNGSTSYGQCCYGNYAGSEWKDYLYCSDLTCYNK